MQLKEDFFNSNDQMGYLGTGDVGGKAKGLELIYFDIIPVADRERFTEFDITVPKTVVIRTDVFVHFMNSNDLWETALSDRSDDRIALTFQQASLPFEILGDLRMIVSNMRLPLAVRSSSLLEDSLYEPFAGVYRTKMTPNNQADIDERFRKLVEAVKYVYASTFFHSAKNYIQSTNKKIEDEKMAIIIQEVIGKKHSERFYPEISGVVRSYNSYPTGGSKPEDGVVGLAFGLGKTIVDEGVSWQYSPSHPGHGPPFKSTKELLRETQLKYWSINIGKPPEYDPIRETEYMVKEHMVKADEHGTLRHVVSTYDSYNDRVYTGYGSDGAKILTFAPILKSTGIPLNDLIIGLLKTSEKVLDKPVEIEFAVSLSSDPGSNPHTFGFLQVRPMVVSSDLVDITESDLSDPDALVTSDTVLGNGKLETIRDIVYIKLTNFDAKQTMRIAEEIEQVNKRFLESGKKYLLIGFGRWGTTDPWAGIPVNWSQISAAKVIIEAKAKDIVQEMSQATHFFHNVSSYQVLYFSIRQSQSYEMIIGKLRGLKTVEETDNIIQVRCDKPLIVKADGRSGKGVIILDR